MHVMIFGCGYSGLAIAKAFANEGVRITGTTRNNEKAARLREHGIEAILFDGEILSQTAIDAMRSVTHLVQSIAPRQNGDPLLALTDERPERLLPSLQWIGYLSTIGVYGDHKGAWVNENTPCDPVSGRSKERLEAEENWLNVGRRAGVSCAVLRLSGIYGPGRNPFLKLENGTARRLIKADQVFNRIRVEDIGASARFLADSQPGGIYNVTDDLPAPPQDIILEAARLMRVEAPPEQPFETADLTPMARSFYGENKRVSNAKIKAAGFEFSYPDYRISLARMWNENSWRE
jgi:nucleoside-diphosphate-sugar epimerase